MVPGIADCLKKVFSTSKKILKYKTRDKFYDMKYLSCELKQDKSFEER